MVVLPSSKSALIYLDPSLPHLTSQPSSVTIPSFEHVKNSIDTVKVSDEEENEDYGELSDAALYLSMTDLDSKLELKGNDCVGREETYLQDLDDGLEESGAGITKEGPEQTLQKIFQVGPNRE